MIFKDLNKEVILSNLEVTRKYLDLSLEKFSTECGRSASYYRNRIKDNIPDLNFIFIASRLVNVPLNVFVTRKLKYKLVLEREESDE